MSIRDPQHIRILIELSLKGLQPELCGAFHNISRYDLEN